MLLIELIDWLTETFGGTHFNFVFDGSWINAILTVLRFIYWVIPFDAVLTCLSLSIVFLGIRVLVAIWKLLPLT